jgi:UDP-N-acetylmuramoyl-L-alanyl-D-glutamate--2,6-diaminopimelate ligase
MEEVSLQQLLKKWATAVAGSDQPQPPAYDGPDVALTALVEHTDRVRPGTAFVARVRTGSDGHPHAGKAAANGASLIIAQRPLADLGIELPPHVPYWQVPDTAVATAWLSAAWHDFPGRHLVVVGVTGTDGKTSTVNLIFEMLRQAGLSAGMVSTIKAAIDDREEPLDLHVTTPEAPVMQRYLRRMVDAGVTHCVIEVTSHALAQHRADATGFDVAVVTNITHEHLDYHGSYETYVAAKARLFEMVADQVQGAKGSVVKTAVLNLDDQSYAPLSRIDVPRRLTYGLSPPADVNAADVRFGPDATHFNLHLAGAGGASPVPVASRLVGDFNVYNMLAAAAAGQALGLAPEVIRKGLEAVEIVSGRMERIDRGQPFLVIVDFAHTPVSLKKAITAARRMVHGRVITVFGSAGKRDVLKRRLMAETSARDADLTVLTAEDPRTDSLTEILDSMAAGCRSQGGLEGENFWRVPDRGEAIYFALGLAQPEDVVLICGKGHEQSMCFGVTEYPWDDRDATRAALDAFLAGKPMVDLGLPTAGSGAAAAGNE